MEKIKCLRIKKAPKKKRQQKALETTWHKKYGQDNAPVPVGWPDLD
jgi:hypothetical protein